MTEREYEAVSVALEVIESQMEQYVKDRTVTDEYEEWSKARNVIKEMLDKEKS